MTKPGRELDALIAEKIMGWAKRPLLHWETSDGRKINRHGLPQYSTDISAAWEVVLKMNEYSDRYFLIEKMGAWLVRFREGTFTPGETAPHAICLAALKAVGVEI